MNQFGVSTMPGTDVGNGRAPFFSADGQWVAFWASEAGGILKKVSVTGGAPVTLCRMPVPPYDASWGSDETILLGLGPVGIGRISANGGNVDIIIKLNQGEQGQSPEALPGGDWILFTLLPNGSTDWNQAQIVAQSVRSGERRVLVNGGRDAHYVETGHLVYVLNGVLFGIRFDAKTRSVLGGPVSLVENVGDAGQVTGAAHFSLASNGTLVYIDKNLVGGVTGLLRTFVWVDRTAYVTRAGARPSGGSSLRHFRVRHGAVRDAVGPARVSPRHDGRHALRDSERGSA